MVEDVKISDPAHPATNVTTYGIPDVPASLKAALATYTNAALPYHAEVYAHPKSKNPAALFVSGRSAPKAPAEFYYLPEVEGTLSRVTDLSGPEHAGDMVNAWVPLPNGDCYFSMDEGGNETWQLWFWTAQRGMERLTQDKARYSSLKLSPCATMLAYASTKRNGKDMDIYVRKISAASPTEDEEVLVLEAEGALAGAWSVADWSSDGRSLLVSRTYSNTWSEMFSLAVSDLEARSTPNQILLPGFSADQHVSAWGFFSKINPDLIYIITDAFSDFRSLCELNRVTGELQHIASDSPSALVRVSWDVSKAIIRKARLVFGTNEDGYSVMRVMDVTTRESRIVTALPKGVHKSLAMRHDGKKIVIEVDSSRAPGTLYEVDTDSLEVSIVAATAPPPPPHPITDPELIHVKSFDGLEIPAFVYAPNHAKVEKAPVCIYIHGGPASQITPSFTAPNHPLPFQFLVQEMGIAVIAPNVRGSLGYGKKFMQADDVLLREDSVKDIGAIIEWIKTQPQYDASKISVMGRSYHLLSAGDQTSRWEDCAEVKLT
ncbi:hypothetical protein BDK51DRAFT_32123 [Blyttiomyces helicus]|uniref:Dipeptidyl-peptidase V n=1 Tax=Blyttiomyces helicus TaxID=388810 RepID=A0A4P9WJ90_9FUNG|nr:hypothetical protein BDK51DRAFT_32123 [Blyttiomyces helicus]|eukprot:RKO92894.1 hypothetical protein BDK51DRAFT_32123 [Blyttiomyces helicus]